MLRPALLLPPKRLVTPRSVRPPLDGRLGPASRRSGTYLHGTLTRWPDGTSRTHHRPRLNGPSPRTLLVHLPRTDRLLLVLLGDLSRVLLRPEHKKKPVG